jgi:hypothetical protein
MLNCWWCITEPVGFERLIYLIRVSVAYDDVDDDDDIVVVIDDDK